MQLDKYKLPYGSTYQDTKRLQRLYPVLGKFEMNPARMDRINAGQVLPNIRIPCRIYSDPEFSKGDKFWETVIMGGEHGDVVYPRLADNRTVFYDHAFYVKKFADPIISNRVESPKGIGAQSVTEIREDIGMAIRGYYRDYNTFIQNYQNWEVDKHELCMPNLMFEANYFIDQRKFQEKLDEIMSSTAAVLDSNKYYSDMNQFVATAAADPDIIRPFDVFYYENLNDEKPYLDMVKYFYPSANKTNIYIPDEDGEELAKGDTIFRTFPNGIEQVKNNIYKNDQWYGETWINSLKDETLKQNIMRAQRNIIYPNEYFENGNGVLYQNEVEKTSTEFGAKNQSANMKSIKITLHRHVDKHGINNLDADGKPLTDSITSIKDKPRNRSDIRALKNNSRYGEFDHHAANTKWHLRWAMENYKYTGKFLENLKDLNDGNLQNFRMTKSPLVGSNYQKFGVGYENDNGIETISNRISYSVDKVSLDSFNFLDFMTYTINNPDEAINDDYIFLGDHSGQNVSSYGDNLLYRFSKSSAGLGVLDASIDSLQQYFREFMPEYIENVITIEDPDTYTDTQAKLYNMFLAPQFNKTECLAYQIDKYGGDATGDNRTQDKIQTWWVWNSSGHLDTTSDDVIPRPFTITDSQVKYGKDYTYSCYGYFAVISHKYKYSDFRLTKQTNAYPGDASSDELTEVVDRFCVQFYEPLSRNVVPQVFAISAVEEAQPQPYLYSNLSEYNSFAPSQFDITKAPELADFHFNVEPCIKIFKVPLYSKIVSVLDNPGNKITAVPFHVINDENKIGFNVSQDNFKPTQYPVCLDGAELALRNEYLNSKDLYVTDEIKYYSQSPARYLEIYKMKNKPTSYFDFGGMLASTIDLRINNELYNRTEFTFSDEIIPNQKYYYMFRLVTENFMPGHVSTIYEAELVDDGGYKYAMFDTVDTSDFKTSPFQTKTDSFKKLLQIEPNVRQMELLTSNADFSKKAKDNLDAVVIGDSDDLIWDKTFKVRLTSKKSGKKTDLNVKFRLQTKDFS